MMVLSWDAGKTLSPDNVVAHQHILLCDLCKQLEELVIEGPWLHKASKERLICTLNPHLGSQRDWVGILVMASACMEVSSL